MAKTIIQRDILAGGDRGQRYDLTEKSLEQYLQFRFGAHDDSIDANSRLYDMDAEPPPAPTAREERVTVYPDGI